MGALSRTYLLYRGPRLQHLGCHGPQWRLRDPLLQPADHYEIRVKQTGFRETVRKDVSLQVAQTAKIDFRARFR